MEADAHMKYHVMLPYHIRPWYELVEIVTNLGYKIHWIESEYDWGVTFDSEEEAALFKLTYL